MCAMWPTVRLRPTPSDARVVRMASGRARVTRVPAVTLAIAKRPGANAVTVAEEIRLGRAAEAKADPEGSDGHVTRDYGETANEKANELLFHLGARDGVDRRAGLGSPSAGARRWWWPSSFR
jgi:hypothetical protein